MVLCSSDGGNLLDSTNKMEQIDQIKEILIKYSTAEDLLDKKLQEIKQEELRSKTHEECNDKSLQEPCKLLNLEEARLRNSNLIKSLEISKARLRSRTTFSPVEQILQQAIDNYRKKPALIQVPSSKPRDSLINC